MNERDFDQLVASVKQAGAIKRGKMKPGRRIQMDSADIRMIRKKLNKSQSEFALMIGVSVSTLQNWEQRRRRPEGPARAPAENRCRESRNGGAVVECLGKPQLLRRIQNGADSLVGTFRCSVILA